MVHLSGSTPTLKQPLLTKQLLNRLINKGMFIDEKIYTNNNLCLSAEAKLNVTLSLHVSPINKSIFGTHFS